MAEAQSDGPGNGHIALANEHKQLLTAEVVLTDRRDRLTRDAGERREAQRRADDRLTALISIVDDLIRKRPHNKMGSGV